MNHDISARSTKKIRRLRPQDKGYFEYFVQNGKQVYQELPDKLYVHEEDYHQISQQIKDDKLSTSINKWIVNQMQPLFDFPLNEISFHLLKAIYLNYRKTKKSRIKISSEFILIARQISKHVPKNLLYQPNLIHYLHDVVDIKQNSREKLKKMLLNRDEFKRIYLICGDHINKYLRDFDVYAIYECLKLPGYFEKYLKPLHVESS